MDQYGTNEYIIFTLIKLILTGLQEGETEWDRPIASVITNLVYRFPLFFYNDEYRPNQFMTNTVIENFYK